MTGVVGTVVVDAVVVVVGTTVVPGVDSGAGVVAVSDAPVVLGDDVDASRPPSVHAVSAAAIVPARNPRRVRRTRCSPVTTVPPDG